MRGLVLVFLLAGCGITDVAEETRKEVQNSNELQKEILENIRKTSDAVHLQVLTIALERMLAKENTAVLNPPVRMMPYAEVFTREATPEEIIKVAHVLLTDARESPAPESERMVSLVGMGCLAALSPEDKFRFILQAQVDDGGRYRDTAYAFALARYMFVRDFLLTPILEKSQYLGIGSLRESVEHFTRLRSIRSLPYGDRLVLNLPSLGVEEKLDPAELPVVGEKARRRFQTGLEGPAVGSLEVQDLLRAFDL